MFDKIIKPGNLRTVLMASVMAALMVAGRLDAGTLTQLSYDPAGRLVALNYGNGTNLSYGFDPGGGIRLVDSYAAANPNLSVAQFCQPSTPMAGATFSLYVTVANHSGALATNVQFTDTLPTNATWVALASSQGSLSQNLGVISGSLGDLAPGAMAVVTVTLRAPAAIGPLRNQAGVSSASGNAIPSNGVSDVAISMTTPPALQMSLGTGSFSLAWPTAAEGFLLEETTILPRTGSWTSISVSLEAISGNQYQLNGSVSATNRFFRLRAP